MAFIHKLLLGIRIVHQQEISIASPRRVQRLACALCDDVDRNARLRRKLREDISQ